MDGEAGARGRAALSRYLEQARAKRGQADYAIPLREPGVDVEATDAQQQLWLHSELASGSPIYNEPVTIHFHGELNVAAFERAFRLLLARIRLFTRLPLDTLDPASLTAQLRAIGETT